jgi:hypothetical protein
MRKWTRNELSDSAVLYDKRYFGATISPITLDLVVSGVSRKHVHRFLKIMLTTDFDQKLHVKVKLQSWFGFNPASLLKRTGECRHSRQTVLASATGRCERPASSRGRFNLTDKARNGEEATGVVRSHCTEWAGSGNSYNGLQFLCKTAL